MKNRRKDRKNITLTVNTKIYDQFSEECRRKGVIKSFVIENFMKTYGVWRAKK